MSSSTYWKVAATRSVVGDWLAWFEHSPEAKYPGKSPWIAIRTLIESVGWEAFDLEHSTGSCDIPPIGSFEFLLCKKDDTNDGV